MLLNNFRRVLVNTISNSLNLSQIMGMTGEIKTTGGKVYVPNSQSYMDFPAINGLGSVCNICTKNTNYNGTSIPTTNINFLGCEIYLGTGNVTPTIDDYKLSGDLVTGLKSQEKRTTANNNSITFLAIATNNTESPVTIKEIGLGGHGGDSGWAFLLTRDVLATPVTLNTGDSKTFSITIDLRSLTDTTVNE
mgnify:CR=1 FL=1|jgi:hypothetical protein